MESMQRQNEKKSLIQVKLELSCRIIFLFLLDIKKCFNGPESGALREGQYSYSHHD